MFKRTTDLTRQNVSWPEIMKYRSMKILQYMMFAGYNNPVSFKGVHQQRSSRQDSTSDEDYTVKGCERFTENQNIKEPLALKAHTLTVDFVFPLCDHPYE